MGFARDYSLPDEGSAASAGLQFRVTAIVSTYCGERFIRGCLEDLAGQTLFAAGGLEVVVVDSASPEGERGIVEEYVRRFPGKVRYVRTPGRETLYAAWNRGVGLARGEYLTNANVDDRHHPEMLERLAAALDAAPDAVLAYADSDVTDEANAGWGEARRTREQRWPDYDRDTLFEYCYVGQAPMWRRGVHAAFGGFDGEMKSAGDYEFWLRLAAGGCRFVHVAERLGLYLERPDALSLGNIDLNWRESEVARDRYWREAWGVPPKFRKAVPAFEALGRRVAAMREAKGEVRVALYGAGKHTRRMLPLFHKAIEEAGGRLVGILDDRVGEGGEALDGVEVVRTAEWERLRPGVVVVSSDTYEEAMAGAVGRVLAQSGGSGVAVWKVYGEAGIAGRVLA
jgi:glycosyltransferase involved in cell wall biosynthesis